MNIVLRRSPTGVLPAVRMFHSPFSLMEDIEQIAGRLWDSWPEIKDTSIVPRTEMYEEKGKLVIKTEMPGIKKEDVDISLEDDILTLKAEKKEEEVTEETDYYAREVHYGQYSRSIKLPFRVNGQKIAATLEDGVLEVTLPKARELKPKKIAVKSQLPEGEHKEQKKRTTKKKKS
jgi:HSP20 family protein